MNDFTPIAATGQLLGLLSEATPHEREKLKDAFMTARATMLTWKPGANRARRVHAEIDKLIAASPVPANSVCTRKCNYCCHIQVTCNEDEADLLVEVIKDRKIVIPRAKLEQQSRMSEDDYMGTDKERSACIFLKNGECSIYEDRPATCRSYFAAVTTENCRRAYSGEQNINIRVCVSASVDTFVAAAMNIESAERFMKPVPTWLLQKLYPNDQLTAAKAIEVLRTYPPEARLFCGCGAKLNEIERDEDGNVLLSGG